MEISVIIATAYGPWNVCRYIVRLLFFRFFLIKQLNRQVFVNNPVLAITQRRMKKAGAVLGAYNNMSLTSLFLLPHSLFLIR